MTRVEWAALGARSRFPADGLIPRDEVAAIYAPFSRLLRRQVHKATTYLVAKKGCLQSYEAPFA
jgi:hypothetical protein